MIPLFILERNVINLSKGQVGRSKNFDFKTVQQTIARMMYLHVNYTSREQKIKGQTHDP